MSGATINHDIKELLNRLIETNCLKEPIRGTEPDFPSLEMSQG